MLPRLGAWGAARGTRRRSPMSRRLRRLAPTAILVFLVGIGVGVAIVAAGGPAPEQASAPASPPTAARPTPERPAPSEVVAEPERAPFLPAGAEETFAEWTARQPGAVAIAVAPLGKGPVRTFGATSQNEAWSTMKVPVVVTLMRDGEGLTDGQAALTEAALTRSDNEAALTLFAELEDRHGGLEGASRQIEQTLRAAGDEETAVNTTPSEEGYSTFGQTQWSAASASTFYRTLARGCLLPEEETAYVLDLLTRIVADQRWGAGSGGYGASVPLAFKGGWGPGPAGEYLVRQSAVVGEGPRGYVMTVLTEPSGSTDAFAAGRKMVTAAAVWTRELLVDRGNRAEAECSP